MKLRRRAAPTPTAPLDERVVLMLLDGYAKSDPRRGPFLKQMLFCAPNPENNKRLQGLWRQHEAFLRAEAARLGLEPTCELEDGRKYFYAESIGVVEAIHREKWRYRQDCIRRGVDPDADPDPAA